MREVFKRESNLEQFQCNLQLEKVNRLAASMNAYIQCNREPSPILPSQLKVILYDYDDVVWTDFALQLNTSRLKALTHLYEQIKEHSASWYYLDIAKEIIEDIYTPQLSTLRQAYTEKWCMFGLSYNYLVNYPRHEMIQAEYKVNDVDEKMAWLFTHQLIDNVIDDYQISSELAEGKIKYSPRPHLSDYINDNNLYKALPDDSEDII